MGVSVPLTIDEALVLLEEHPNAHLLAGGTDFMVEVNFGHRRPTEVVTLGRVRELAGWCPRNGEVVLRAGVTYTEMEEPDLAELVPALAQAARTVGSPQIRNAGTLGGNLGTASPAGDTLPVLAALDARIVVVSASGRREVDLEELVTGPKQHTLEPGEIIAEVRVPVARGSQEFLKVGIRNAMTISMCNVALIVDRRDRALRCAIGAAGPVIIRARDAEDWVRDRIDWDGRRSSEPSLVEEFGRRVSAAARPIDDHRSTADYRRHAVGVLAARALKRAL